MRQNEGRQAIPGDTWFSRARAASTKGLGTRKRLVFGVNNGKDRRMRARSCVQSCDDGAAVDAGEEAECENDEEGTARL